MTSEPGQVSESDDRCGVAGHNGGVPHDAAGFSLRPGSPADAEAVLGLFDAAVRWQVAQGLSAQWGQVPFSEVPTRVAAVRAWAASGGLRMAFRAGMPVGAMVVGSAPPYVPAVRERELYVVALVTCRCPPARGAGRALLAAAKDEARTQGARLLRVDCFAGNGGRLVRYYEGAGFVRAASFEVGAWPGSVLECWLDPETQVH